MKAPCEIIVWYLLPAIRREFARALVDTYGLTQRGAAEKLGLTESAVSQYLHSKRGNEIRFSQDIITKIEESARGIAESGESSPNKICAICTKIRTERSLEELHAFLTPSSEVRK